MKMSSKTRRLLRAIDALVFEIEREKALVRAAMRAAAPENQNG